MSDTAHKLWQRGMTLYWAQKKLAEPSVIESVKRQAKESAEKSERAKADGQRFSISQDRNSPEARELFFSGMKNMFESLSFTIAGDQPLRENIQEKLLRGHLVGYGFEPPRRVTNEPHAIPRETWNGKINWDKSEVSHEGLSFIAVRVINSHSLPPDQPKALVAPAPRQGRPSVQHLIDDTYQAMRNGGDVDFGTSKAAIYREVRSRVRADHPDNFKRDDAPTDKTLAKYLAKQIDEDRAKFG